MNFDLMDGSRVDTVDPTVDPWCPQWVPIEISRMCKYQFSFECGQTQPQKYCCPYISYIIHGWEAQHNFSRSNFGAEFEFEIAIQIKEFLELVRGYSIFITNYNQPIR